MHFDVYIWVTKNTIPLVLPGAAGFFFFLFFFFFAALLLFGSAVTSAPAPDAVADKIPRDSFHV